MECQMKADEGEDNAVRKAQVQTLESCDRSHEKSRKSRTMGTTYNQLR